MERVEVDLKDGRGEEGIKLKASKKSTAVEKKMEKMKKVSDGMGYETLRHQHRTVRFLVTL
jgi:hypothetical protein